MGVYIPNMEKPKDCKNCQWHLDFYIEDEQVGGLCTITEKDDKENTCPLIEIPTPHGRLIDENDVKAKCVNEVFDKMGTVAITETYFGDEWVDDICDIPTIIEAEE